MLRPKLAVINLVNTLSFYHVNIIREDTINSHVLHVALAYNHFGVM